MRRCQTALLAIFSLSALPFTAVAATVYNETVNGDLSNSGLSPTSVSIGLGSNEIFGTTGSNASGAVDRDYFTITVPTGEALTAINVLPGTQSGGFVSFIGVEAGDQVTVSTHPSSAAGLLGWWHYNPSDIGADILPNMASSTAGSSGFAVPLESGAYSFWIQDYNPGSFKYGFDLETSATPEPGSASLLLSASAGMIALGLRRRFARS